MSHDGCGRHDRGWSGTKVVLADGRTKPIENVAIGDHVLATDPHTGKTEAKTVAATITGNGNKNLVRITIYTGGPAGQTQGHIVATDGHPFWLPDRHQWIKATDLQPGQWLQTSAGTWVQITAIQRWTQTATVHNLTVTDIHTYYVVAGDTPVLVHNCGWGAGMGGKEHKLGMASGWITGRTKALFHELTGSQPKPNATVGDLLNLNPGNRRYDDKRDSASSRDPEELIASIFRPRSLQYMTVNPHNRMVLFEGNHRRYELLDRLEDPTSGITLDTEIYIHRF